MAKDWIVMDSFGEVFPSSEDDTFFKTRKAAEDKARELADQSDTADAEYTVYESVRVAFREPAKIQVVK